MKSKTIRISTEMDAFLDLMSKDLSKTSGLPVSKVDASRLASRVLVKNFKLKIPKAI